jgi:hypothetical protein
MSRPGLEPGPPAWEASTLEKSQLDSLYTGGSEPLLIISLLHPDLYMSLKTNRLLRKMHRYTTNCDEY